MSSPLGEVPDAVVLPYTDRKPVGAADFYFAINATFRFIMNRLGPAALQAYWSDLGRQYFAPVSERWKQHGLTGIADYWEAFFKAEPGAEVEVRRESQAVVLQVKRCPAIHQLREAGREIVPCFCQHCYFMGEATAAAAGFTVRVEGGNGRCVQTFTHRDASLTPQDLSKIAEATC